MAADDEQTDHRHDVQHREQQADGQIVFDTQPLLYDGRPPESHRRIAAGKAELNNGEQPHLRSDQRAYESMLPWTGLAVISFEILDHHALLVGVSQSA